MAEGTNTRGFGEPSGTAEVGSTVAPEDARPSALNWKIGVCALVLVALGATGLLLIAGFHDESATYGFKFRNAMVDLGRGLCILGIEIGVVAVIFEVIMARERGRIMAEVTRRILSDELRPLSTKVAEQTAAVVLGDADYVHRMSGEGRQEFLRLFMGAQLDPTAEDLVIRAARELSGETRYWNYRATFTLIDAELDAGEEPHLLLERSFQTNVRPARISHRFETRAMHVEEPPPPLHDEDVFSWALRLHPGGTHEGLLAQFRVLAVSLDDVEMINEPLTRGKQLQRSTGTWSHEFEIRPPTLESERPKHEYSVRILLRLPPIVPNRAYTLVSGSLTKGFAVRCDYARSIYRPTPIEHFRSGHVRVIDEPRYHPIKTTMSIETQDWVMPSAVGGFVFSVNEGTASAKADNSA